MVSNAASTCVVIGIATSEYSNYLVRRHMAGVSSFSATGGAPSVASGRLAYVFGFNVRVFTGNSSS